MGINKAPCLSSPGPSLQHFHNPNICCKSSEQSMSAGLHEGLRTLNEGSVPPKFLIIDDGWQCTDVDVPQRKPVTSRMLVMPEMRESMAETEDEFIEAEARMLKMIARDIPPSSSAGERLTCMA